MPAGAPPAVAERGCKSHQDLAAGRGESGQLSRADEPLRRHRPVEHRWQVHTGLRVQTLGHQRSLEEIRSHCTLVVQRPHGHLLRPGLLDSGKSGVHVADTVRHCQRISGRMEQHNNIIARGIHSPALDNPLTGLYRPPRQLAGPCYALPRRARVSNLPSACRITLPTRRHHCDTSIHGTTRALRVLACSRSGHWQVGKPTQRESESVELIVLTSDLV